MKYLSKIIKMTVLITLICVCGVKLWAISAAYIGGNGIKTEMQEYIAQRTVTDSYEIINIETQQPAAFAADIIFGSKKEQDNKAETGVVTASDNKQENTMRPVKNLFIYEMQEDINSDITGRLAIPGTGIDYPVMKTDDNEFYLRRDIYKNDAKAGSLFIDYRCAPDFTSFNTIIYGHNMKNRSMFGNLKSYADPDFFEENKYGILQTVSDTYTIEIFAYMLVRSDDPEIYANPPSREAFIEYVKENALIYNEPYPGTSPADISSILTMSTCAYGFDNARIVVLATLRKS